jgi:hypothetical protein
MIRRLIPTYKFWQKGQKFPEGLYCCAIKGFTSGIFGVLDEKLDKKSKM